MSSIKRQSPEMHYHGPDNAEHELRKAYNTTIESGLAFFWDRRAIAGVDPSEVLTLYKRAYNLHRKGDKLAAERWARTAKHLARAFWAEAKIAYLAPRITELPFLEGAQADEFGLHEHSDTTADLLDSLAEHIPPGMDVMPEDMRRYLSRARRMLQALIDDPNERHELLRAERIKAAHEYGRVLECIALAYEAEASGNRAA